MNDKLVKALRCDNLCVECAYFKPTDYACCDEWKMRTDAADAIEKLMAERKQLVRCGECKYSREFDGKIEWCSRTMQYVPKDFHCGVKGLKS